MPGLVPDPNLVAHCGLYCGACRKHLAGKCPGCRLNEKATWCTVRSCCREHQYGSCADCTQCHDPNQCGKFNNFIAKLFGLVFNSNRRACIEQIRELGPEGHAARMAAAKRHSLPRK